MLFNLWATWCVPCRKEMPALDELQAKLGGADFEVVAVNIDTRDPEKPRAWLKEVGIERLAYYADPAAKVFQELKQAGKAWGMPTTILVDGAGCEIGTLAGPAEWASEDAIKLVSAALGRTSSLDRNIEVLPMPAATLARRSMFCCAASITFTTDAAASAFMRSILAATAI